MMNARQNGFTLVEIALFFRMIAMLRDSYRKLEDERPLLAGTSQMPLTLACPLRALSGPPAFPLECLLFHE